MRRFLIAAGSECNPEALAKLSALVKECRTEGLLLVGGALSNNPASHGEKLSKWEAFFDCFGKLGVFTALIPGTADAPLREFLRLAKDAELEYPTIHVAHATLFEEDDVAVNGLGGELTEAEDHFEHRLSYSRPSAEYFLRTLWRAEQPHKILLLNVTPPGQLGGDDGNRICGDFIDTYHPSLCVVAGTTERRGFQQIAHTLVVNPGRLADGSVARLDWSSARGEQVGFPRL